MNNELFELCTLLANQYGACSGTKWQVLRAAKNGDEWQLVISAITEGAANESNEPA